MLQLVMAQPDRSTRANPLQLEESRMLVWRSFVLVIMFDFSPLVSHCGSTCTEVYSVQAQPLLSSDGAGTDAKYQFNITFRNEFNPITFLGISQCQILCD